jgi:outer membrane protein
MKNLSIALNAVLLVAVGILFYWHFNANQSSKPAGSATSSKPISAQSGQLAYIELDSLEHSYIYYRDKKQEFEKRQRDVESSLAAKAERAQRELLALRDKVTTQAQAEELQQKAAQKQSELEQEKESRMAALVSEQQKINEELFAHIDSFMVDFNKDKKYAFILSYTKGSTVLYRDHSYDITREVIDGLNTMDKKK